MFATAGSDGVVRVYDEQAAAPLVRLDKGNDDTTCGHTARVFGLVWKPEDPQVQGTGGPSGAGDRGGLGCRGQGGPRVQGTGAAPWAVPLCGGGLSAPHSGTAQGALTLR
jgi:hypothetical protein